MMRFAKAVSHPDAKDKNGDVKASVRERLKRYEVEPTWCKPSAFAFSIAYRRKTRIPGANSDFLCPSGCVTYNHITITKIMLIMFTIPPLKITKTCVLMHGYTYHSFRYFLRFGRVDGRNGHPDGRTVQVKFRCQYLKNAPTGHGFVIGTNAHMRLHR